ncbi:glycosyltransferase family 4 protein [Streptomyces sp. NBC_00080]|uniref:glycosyltransferase family 4 protein n=1 Tax=Streptomyces TaxID=1883 RepID=UPI00135903D0|nr:MULTISPECIES: glycosyltransferase family 4 protein [Streptomyces]
MFETDAVPREWVDAAKGYDQIWVPTDFNVQTYADAGIPHAKLVTVPCPLPVWSSQLLANLERPIATGRAPYMFLSVMRWHLRKGWDILVRSFAQEFGDDLDVRLVIKARPFDLADPEGPHRELARFFADMGESVPANISVRTDEMSHAELAALYGRADAFVLPSRGEGWGRPFIESMLSGLPTIGPRWGGNLEFMNDGNSVLVDGTLTPVLGRAAEEWPYFTGHRWWEVSVDELRRAMRRTVVASGADESATEAVGKRWEIAKRLLDAYAEDALGQLMMRHLASLE